MGAPPEGEVGVGYANRVGEGKGEGHAKGGGDGYGGGGCRVEGFMMVQKTRVLCVGTQKGSWG